MKSADFEYLINQIGHKIGKKTTPFRDPIPVRERLAVTLRFLASGDSYRSLSYIVTFSTQSISVIVPKVCNALIACLSDKIKMPKLQEEWLQVANDFNRMWNYPHCCGSIDGKHICLQAPINTGSDYFNYKGFFSIVLLSIVGAKYSFTFVSVGCQGRLSDGGVFTNTTFKQ
ncbi:unnamed protein product [Acanthoscelides obtectus]|uniref:DDE Tnp4 domain-containing protein n=1 Tax=Acanthoscelides obtectus TaxID=200917 RepID=A0A9P0JZT2_ACAOB|nr:unnamed protein product [Acanthoscelides obtectus]CAK1647951.1 Protein ALP1-like [Acanthoscelides obtectus]